jgi:dUTPase
MVKDLVDKVNKITRIIKDFGIRAKYKGVLSSAMGYLKDNHVKIKSSTEIGQELKNRRVEVEKSKQNSLRKERGFGLSEGQGHSR